MSGPGTSAQQRPLEVEEAKALAARARRQWLTVEMPDRADGALRLEWGGANVTVRALGASPAGRRVEGGVAIYRGAYPSTDVLQVPRKERVEEFLYLRDERAPNRFEYGVSVSGGALRGTGEVVDADGVAQLRVLRPWAVDARGRHVDADLAVADGRIVVSLDTRGLTFPVLLDPTWETTGAMAQARFDHAVALLGDGRVLACGGTADGTTPLASCGLFSPHSGVWTTTVAMPTARLGGNLTVLPNGSVLACGGGTVACEVFDPVAGTWAATAAMAAARAYATATLLRTGKVLVVGGESGGTAELYDPAAGTWSSAGTITARSRATATLLGDGRVLVVGGTGAGGPVTAVDLYNPATNVWTAAAALPVKRSEHTATRLRTGKVLVAGGTDGTATLATAVLYDEVAGTWAATGSLVAARRRHAAALAAGGKVLVLGGSNGSAAIASTEVYDPASGTFATSTALTAARERLAAVVLASNDVLAVAGRGAAALATVERITPDARWSPTASMAAGRYYHSATLLSNGRVLVAGGRFFNWGTGNQETRTSAELYDPATGSWSAAAVMPQGRDAHTATLLPSGRVDLLRMLVNRAVDWASGAPRATGAEALRRRDQPARAATLVGVLCPAA
ncbi:MAG: hypothetical protein HY906_26865, partial [Deltaproteobacteria bacterium]|nr:hypothetical protein [Deltaproteobacteria bacterium]